MTDWLDFNLLTLNTAKTKYITFSIRNTSQPLPETISIKSHSCNKETDCTCRNIERTDNIRYLGVELDNNLNWKGHVAGLTGRVRKLIYIFKNLRHVCDSGLLISIYYALCQSIITYCITAWGGSAKTTMLPLERAQRAVLKVMLFKSFRYPTDDLYKASAVLTVRQLFIKGLILDQHKILPSHSITRRRIDLVYSIPKCKSAFSRRFHKLLGPLTYNRISKHVILRNLSSYQCKKVLNKFLFSLSYAEAEKLLIK